MSTVIDFAQFSLSRLDPEPWGKRMTRARESANLTVRGVEDLTDGYVSKSTLSRLEDLSHVPEKKKDRQRAVVCLVLYNVDPTDFGLGPDDWPELVDLTAVAQANLQSLCIAGGNRVDALAA